MVVQSKTPSRFVYRVGVRSYALLRFKADLGYGYRAAAFGAGRARRKSFEHIAHIGIVYERQFVIAFGATLVVYVSALLFILYGTDLKEHALH